MARGVSLLSWRLAPNPSFPPSGEKPLTAPTMIGVTKFGSIFIPLEALNRETFVSDRFTRALRPVSEIDITIPGMSNAPESLSSTSTCFPTVSLGGFVVLQYDLCCGLNAVLDSLRRMYASCAATSVSTGERSGGVNHPGWRIGRPNHCLEGDNCPGSRGVSFHNDHPWTKSSFAD